MTWTVDTGWEKILVALLVILPILIVWWIGVSLALDALVRWIERKLSG